MSGWTPLARWASVVPVTILALIFFRFSLGGISILFERSLPGALSGYFVAIVTFFLYMFTVYTAGAAAPVGGRIKVAATLAIIISICLVALNISVWTQVQDHDAIILIVNTLAGVFGCVKAVALFFRKNTVNPNV